MLPGIVELIEGRFEDGDRLEVVVHWAGPETVSVAGRPVRATRYIVSGDVERELWYGADGMLVRLQRGPEPAAKTSQWYC
jgi:hypothetical protein